MTDANTALKAAINFIESVHTGEWSGGDYSRDEILTIIKAALAEIEKCEPVAWLNSDNNAVITKYKKAEHPYPNFDTPLYTSPHPIQRECEPLPPIEYDADMDRYYIPIIGGWEIQTKGKGSTFRICNTKTHMRWPVLDEYLHEALEQMAKDNRQQLNTKG